LSCDGDLFTAHRPEKIERDHLGIGSAFGYYSGGDNLMKLNE
jgi:hypothetical protein